MQHLESTRLAAFDHDPLTVDELAHLAACAMCRAEREAMMQLVSRAGAQVTNDLTANAARLVPWDSLARGLRDAGLLTTGEHALELAASDDAAVAPAVVRALPHSRVTSAERPVSSKPWFIRARQAAAAVALIVGGAAVGRLSSAPAGDSLLPLAQAGTAAQRIGFGDDGFASVHQATDVLNRAQRDYERASLWLAANDTTIHDSDVYRARLAALDQMMAASRAALRDAPQDPVLNHYYLSAYTAREATLQALSSALPVDKIIERY